MKKIAAFLTFFFLSLFASFAEKPLDITVSFAPTLIVNTDDDKDSAPSPFVFPFSIGIVIPKDNFVSFQPRLSFFTNYYLLNENGAAPAEIENRTATAFSFLLDLPACFTFKPAEKHWIEAGAGPSILFRFAVLSKDVSSSDAGYNGNTASDDVSEINSWFWKDGNFLFLDTYGAYLYTFTPKIKAGPELKFYLPFGSIFSGNGLNCSMLSLGIKARF